MKFSGARNFRTLSKLSEQLRSSHPEVFCKEDVLRNFAKFTGKHPCQSLFFNKVAVIKELLFNSPTQDTKLIKFY